MNGSMKKYSIGIDLGGTNIAAALVSHAGVITIRRSIPTQRGRNYKLIVKDMAMLCSALIEEKGLEISNIVSIGIGSPGLLDKINGLVCYANNLEFENAPICPELLKYLSIPVYLENDANAAAFGEYMVGAGKYCSNLVVITLGTGVGSGVIMNNEIMGGDINPSAE